MPFSPYQIITPIVSFIAIVYAWNFVARQKKTIWEAVLWTIFWGAIAYIAIVPSSIDYLTAVTGIQDRENAVMVTLLGILLFVVFYLVMRMESLEQKLTRVIRGRALEDAGLKESEYE